MAHSVGLEKRDLDDYELILIAKNGDEEAFSLLIKRYHLQLFNMLYALVGDWDVADDLAQETFLKMHRALPGFEGRAQFYTWLYRIGVNCWKDWCKTPCVQKEVSEFCEDGQSVFDKYESSGATDTHVESGELQFMLEHALSKLQNEYRVAVILREIDGLGYDEIAEVLECSVGTVKSRLFRGRTQLKKLWDIRYRNYWEGDGTSKSLNIL